MTVILIVLLSTRAVLIDANSWQDCRELQAIIEAKTMCVEGSR